MLHLGADLTSALVECRNNCNLICYCCGRVDTAAGLLPDAFELDERSSWDASDDVLQLVSGRQVWRDAGSCTHSRSSATGLAFRKASCSTDVLCSLTRLLPFRSCFIMS